MADGGQRRECVRVLGVRICINHLKDKNSSCSFARCAAVFQQKKKSNVQYPVHVIEHYVAHDTQSTHECWSATSSSYIYTHTSRHPHMHVCTHVYTSSRVYTSSPACTRHLPRVHVISRVYMSSPACTSHLPRVHVSVTHAADENRRDVQYELRASGPRVQASGFRVQGLGFRA